MPGCGVGASQPRTAGGATPGPRSAAGLPCELRQRGEAKGAAQPGRERRGRGRSARHSRGGPAGPPAAGGARREQSRGRRPARPGRRAESAGAPPPAPPRHSLLPHAAVPALTARSARSGPGAAAAGCPARPPLTAPSCPRPARVTAARRAPPPARDCAGAGGEADKERRPRPGTGTAAQRYGRVDTASHCHRNSGGPRVVSRRGKGRCLIKALGHFSPWERLRELGLLSPRRGG